MLEFASNVGNSVAMEISTGFITDFAEKYQVSLEIPSSKRKTQVSSNLTDFVTETTIRLDLIDATSSRANIGVIEYWRANIFYRIIDTVKGFLHKSSTIRWYTMKKFVKTNLKGSSQTRWSAKHVAVKALLNNLPEVVESLEELKQTSHAPEAKYEAIRNFKFIFNLTIWANILSEINRVNIEIQKQDIILARSVSLMDDLRMRENSIEHWIEEAKEVAGKIGVEPILSNKRIPRCKKQFVEM
ncbi:unnamed protein product [Psylliodes chrysocephalus]|uniref:Uncharacterized protein n=1 Tax=Psylliodes chrysocephalus TaxID=3402493 RepID=A0A9P0CDN2_9CUCU|nr:unnamed protein product [Psylliodes chrysocephala]